MTRSDESAGQESVPGLAARVVTESGSVAIDPHLDRLLPGTPIEVCPRPDTYRLPAPLAELTHVVVDRAARVRPVFNGPALRLVTHLDAATVTAGRPVLVEETDFYSLLSSNDLPPWAADRIAGPSRRASGIDTGTPGRLPRLDHSVLANAIGVSTLAITTDDHLVVTRQSAAAHASSGLLAPSGSGGLEPGDLQPGASLQDLVITGAERELREEIGIDHNLIIGTAVIGYGRWLERRGKPEFFAVTALDVTAGALRAMNLHHTLPAHERRWIQDIRPVRLRPGVLAPTAPVSGPAAALFDKVDLPGSMSLPLAAALDALTRTLHHHPALLTQMRTAAQ